MRRATSVPNTARATSAALELCKLAPEWTNKEYSSKSKMAFDPCGDQLKIENWKTTKQQNNRKKKEGRNNLWVQIQPQYKTLYLYVFSAKICKKIVQLTWSCYKQVSKRITTTQMSDLDPRLLPVSWYEKSLGGACEIPNIYDILLWWISRQTTYSCHIKNIRAIRNMVQPFRIGKLDHEIEALLYI